jgi:hypothetical protein
MLHTSDGIRETVQPSFLDLLEQRQKTSASTPTHSLNVNDEERGEKIPPFVRQLRNNPQQNQDGFAEAHRAT